MSSDPTKTKNRARQLAPGTIGVAKWQRDFWLTLLEHELAGGKGRPDLSGEPGFDLPAISRFAVTTPALARHFATYNRGKPYEKQVRPFGFMLALQLDEEAVLLADAHNHLSKRSATALRALAPFDRSARNAAKHAFDRDTGKPIPASHLKTYARALRNFYSHPELKFLNGDRGDRGPTQRRHVIADSIRLIGKEANQLSEQLAFGLDPEAQLEFGTISATDSIRMKRIASAVHDLGASAIATQAQISRLHLHKLIRGNARSTGSVLEKLEAAIAVLQTEGRGHEANTSEVLERVRTVSGKFGLRAFAASAGVSAGHLSLVLAGERRCTKRLLRKLNLALEALSP
jgi:hypothetical protein